VGQVQLRPERAWRGVLSAGISNSLVKWGVAVALGGAALGRRLIPFFIVAIGTSLAFLLLL